MVLRSCSPGFKYNLTDLAAAIGIEQLKKCGEFWEARQRIAAVYQKAFAELEEVQLPPSCGTEMQHAWHLFILQLNLRRLKVNRNQFVDLLRENEIGTSVHFIPLHLHPFYRDRFGYKPAELSECERGIREDRLAADLPENDGGRRGASRRRGKSRRASA